MTDKQPDPLAMSCPTPPSVHDTVQLAHGGGGRLVRGLIEGLLLPELGAPPPIDNG